MEKDTREFVYIAHCDQLDRWGNFVDGDAEIFDDLDKDDFRLALVEFNKAVKEYIVVHSTTYNKFEWGV